MRTAALVTNDKLAIYNKVMRDRAKRFYDFRMTAPYLSRAATRSRTRLPRFVARRRKPSYFSSNIQPRDANGVFADVASIRCSCVMRRDNNVTVVLF